MKVTKVAKTRIAVSANNVNGDGRGFLYQTPNEKGSVQTVEKQLEGRISNANRLYGVFFRSDSLCQNIKNLEKYFAQILQQVATYKETDVAKKIQYLQSIKKLSWSKKNKKTNKTEEVVVSLSEFRCPEATEECLKEMLTRMRKPLKRGTNGEVAIRLLQGLAQMDGKTLASVITEMLQNDKEKEALEKFINAVDENYHKTYIIKSIKNHDVKVQVHDDKLDLSSINIEKVDKKKKNKVALSTTLERYAASPESSVQILKEVKGVLLDYFMGKESKVKEEFTRDDKLWKIPNRIEEFFDTDFEAIDDKKKQKVEAREELDAIWCSEEVKYSDIKKRINYVNCGKYQQLIKNETDDIRIYWIGYVKNYIEKNYVTKKRIFTREDCYKTKMLLECWKDVLRFICGKYIDLGKAVYHFAMPEVMSAEKNLCYGSLDEKYQQGISSFAYEAIKAEENIQRDIAKATVAAATAFSSSVLDPDKHQKAMEEEGEKEKGEKLEDILFMKEDAILRCAKNKDVMMKQLLRFYGGYSAIREREKLDSVGLMKELLSHIKAIRNENFHFTNGKIVEADSKYTEVLWKNEQAAYKQGVREKYYSNNVAMFYPQEEVCKLVESLYQKDSVSEAQIPAFRTIWQRKLLPEYISGLSCPRECKNDVDKTVIFEGALYFLLKEIYYRDFILSKEAKNLFFKAVENYKDEMNNASKSDSRNKEKRALANAGSDFKRYVDKLNTKDNTFGKVCQFINTEYNQQNRGKQEEEIYKHFKMILPICVRKAFQSYIDEHYEFIKKPTYVENVTGDYLENIGINCMEMKPELAHWFTFAHFIHPRQLNFLVGNFKDYIQYRKDVFRRAGYAGQFANEKERATEERLVNKSVEKAENILEVLEFVRHVSGRVSNDLSDYYQNQDDYKKYMSKYIETNVDWENYDIYADAKNAKVLRNVEIARMYAGGDMAIPSYPKIRKAELEEYYKDKDRIAQIQSRGICKNEKEQKEVVRFQQLKGRITLNEVTDLFSLTNDLLGNLVSLSYLRERDEMYLFLGFYYMALRHAEGWGKEALDTVRTSKYAVAKGLVLYQTLAVFDFGTNLLCQDEKGEWKEKTGAKWKYFINNHPDTYNCVIPLFEITKYGDNAKDTRNYVDHSKYYVDHRWSILDLYSQFYTQSFGYSSKLRKSVLSNLQGTLEKYFVVSKLRFEGMTNVVLEGKPTSKQFVYKYEDSKSKVNKSLIKTTNIDAKSKTFVDAVYELLKYKKE